MNFAKGEGVYFMRKSVIVLMLLFALTVVACTSVDDETYDHYANEADELVGFYIK